MSPSCSPSFLFFSLTSTGKWYYEVIIHTPLLFQIGWANSDFCPSLEVGGDGREARDKRQDEKEERRGRVERGESGAARERGGREKGAK
jgi:hypothetical protein